MRDPIRTGESWAWRLAIAAVLGGVVGLLMALGWIET